MLRLASCLFASRAASGGQSGVRLTAREFRVLAALGEGTCQVGALRSLLGTHAAQVTRILRRLEEGYQVPLITCAMSRDDRRRKDVTLTRAGRKAVDRYRGMVLSRASQAPAQFSDADCRRLLRVLGHPEQGRPDSGLHVGVCEPLGEQLTGRRRGG